MGEWGGGDEGGMGEMGREKWGLREEVGKSGRCVCWEGRTDGAAAADTGAKRECDGSAKYCTL